MKFVTFLSALFLAAVHGCSQEAENARVGALRADYQDNLPDLKKLVSPQQAGLLDLVKDDITCGMAKSQFPTICTISMGMDMATNCCFTCGVITTQAPTAAVITTQAPTAAVITTQAPTAAVITTQASADATTAAAIACSQEAENGRNGDFKAAFETNLPRLKLLVPDQGDLLEAAKTRVTCSMAKAVYPAICTADIHTGLDTATNCCFTCKVPEATTATKEPLTNVPNDETTPEALTGVPGDGTTTKRAATTPEQCSGPDNEYGPDSLNESIDFLLGLAATQPNLKDHFVVRQLTSMKKLRGGKGFTCSEAKLYLHFASKSCNEPVLKTDLFEFQLDDYCCQTCSQTVGTGNLGNCPSTGAETCEQRAACNSGYTQFLAAVADMVSDLPFTPTELFCLVEEQLNQLGGTPVDWKRIADLLAANGANACVATVGPYADAVQNLVTQLPAALPASVWNSIGGLLGQACGAIQNYEGSLDTVLQAMPDNAQDYNRMMAAIADIVGKFIDGKPGGVAAQDVIDYLLDQYDWQDVCDHLDDNQDAVTDSDSVRQHKILARVFNSVVSKTTDFTRLFQLLQKIVAYIFADGKVQDVLAKVKNNEILGYEDTKQCVQATIKTVQGYCSDTDDLFKNAAEESRLLLISTTDASSDASSDATTAISKLPGNPDGTDDTASTSSVVVDDAIDNKNDGVIAISASLFATVLGVLAL